MKAIFIFIMSLLQIVNAKAQSEKLCDSIYKTMEVSVQAKYGQSDEDLFKFVSDEIVPFLSKESKPITKLHLPVLIDLKGKIIEVNFDYLEVSERTKSLIEQKLKAMSNWKAAKINESRVCSIYNIHLSCIFYR